MKRLLISLLATALVLSAFSGCSGGDTPAEPDATPDTTAEDTAEPEPAPAADAETPDAEEPAASGDGTVIEYLSWQAEATKTLEEDAIAAYMAENPGITVNAQFVAYDDYTPKLNTLLAAKSDPDVYLLQEYYTLQYGSEGQTENLAPYFEAIGVNPAEKFVAGTAAMKDSDCFGIGKDAATIVFYYSKPLFEKYGVTPPPASPSEAWTWDQFVEAANTLTVDTNGKNAADPDFDSTNIATYGTIVQTKGWLQTLPMLYSNGGAFGSDDGMSSRLTSPETVDCITKLNDLITSNVAPTPAVVNTIPVLSAMMKADQLAMYWSGVWESAPLKEAGVDFGMTAIPKMKDATGHQHRHTVPREPAQQQDPGLVHLPHGAVHFLNCAGGSGRRAGDVYPPPIENFRRVADVLKRLGEQKRGMNHEIGTD